ncbi:MAG: hypothetical protein MUF47_08605 [Porphyrobacter sp.]|jgi:hypothetical protein|nr:hypothetical protein [Porphyrobacter sp.]
MKIISMAAISAAMAFATIPFAGPAAAQGTVTKQPEPKNGGCPKTWQKAKRGSDTTWYCYPEKDSPPIYPREVQVRCADGYKSEGNWCVGTVAGSSSSSASSGSSYEGPAADRLVSYGTITKANKLDRCPLGYFSKSDMTICTTRLSPAPKSRVKDGACNSNEIDEWGLYCTADANVITRQQAEQEATRDFNAIYSANGANYPAQGSDTEDYLSMVAAYGPKNGAAPASAAASNTGDQAAAPATPQTAQCTTDSGSATGAAIGGAVGGEAGAALGGMLGGLGKKKKKKGC